MSEIRVIQGHELVKMMRIVREAYPELGITGEDSLRAWTDRFKTMERDKTWTPYGVFRDGHMVGVYRNYDFILNVRGNHLSAGGLGMVAVELTHKKERVAKDIVEAFLAHYYDRGDAVTTLWPFRIDFYHSMGFGLGSRRYQYRIDPASLPRGQGKQHVRYLTEDDIPAINDCYNRVFETQNGMIKHNEARWKNRFEFIEKLRYVGFEIDQRLDGYLIYSFKNAEKPTSFMDSELVVSEFFYHSPQALSELLAFLHSQLDQVSRIVLEISEDEFYFLMSNPTFSTGSRMAPNFHESHMAGLGIMYRVMDLKRLFDALTKPSFGDDRLSVKINLRDTFLPRNNGARVVRFEGGIGKVDDNTLPDVVISLDVAEFSSMLMAAVGFKKLHTYGLAQISDPAFVDRIDRLFAYSQKPLCVTGF